MNEGTRNLLDAKLKKMIHHLDQAEAKKKQPMTQSGTGNIIRRRTGEKEKRFSVLSTCSPVCIPRCRITKRRKSLKDAVNSSKG
jgi:hypothetical protein